MTSTPAPQTLAEFQRDSAYDPREDKNEFLNPAMRSYFRECLKISLAEVRHEQGVCRRQFEDLRSDVSLADVLDRATSNVDTAMLTKRALRASQLEPKIIQALARVETDDFGYCAETGEEIEIGRLMSRPWTEMCAEIASRRERMQGMVRVENKHAPNDVLGILSRHR